MALRDNQDAFHAMKQSHGLGINTNEKRLEIVLKLFQCFNSIDLT